VSRALGDHAMKQSVISEPHFWEDDLSGEDTFVIIACDGLFYFFLWEIIAFRSANLASCRMTWVVGMTLFPFLRRSFFFFVLFLWRYLRNESLLVVTACDSLQFFFLVNIRWFERRGFFFHHCLRRSPIFPPPIFSNRENIAKLDKSNNFCLHRLR